MRAAASLLAAVLIATPLLAQAQTTSDVSSLMAEIAALEQQIQALGGSAPAATASASVSASSNTSNGSGIMCPSLPRTLSLGASGPDVSSLQQFLAQAGDFSASATGYFGSVTQASVEAWQSEHGVVSSGTPSTTGYGVVGPKTSAAIAAACGGSATAVHNRCLPAQPPAQECSTSWQPVADQNGCTIYYTCSIALPTSAPTVGSSATTSATATTTAPSSAAICPVVTKPTCSGTVKPFGTNANGCVTGYECVL